MSVSVVAEQLAEPYANFLVEVLEHERWTGRPGYPARAMVGMALVRSVYGLRTWAETARLVAAHDGLRSLLGCAPSNWACYRFARTVGPLLDEGPLSWR